MAFETGTSSSLADLIDNRLKSFLVANGWTLNNDSWATHLALSYGACFVNLRFDSSSSTSILSQNAGTMTATDDFGFERIDVRMWAHLSSGYNAAGGWPGQPDSPVNGATTSEPFCIINDLNGPFPTYYFFGNNAGDPLGYCYVVIETRPGFFTHLMFGEVDQGGIGYSPGGAFLTGSYYRWWPQTSTFSLRDDRSWDSSTHNMPFSDSGANSNQQFHVYGGGALPGEQVRPTATGTRPGVFLARPNNNSALPDAPGSEWTGIDLSNQGQWFQNSIFRGQVQVSGVTPLQSVPIMVEALADEDVIQYLGEAVNMRFCSMLNLTPGQRLQFGADTWFAFPVRKQDTQGDITSDRVATPPELTNTSFQWGFAYKQVI